MSANITDRARNYIAALPPSIEGSGGSAAIFEAAQALVRGFNLPEQEAFPLLLQWNQDKSLPPWSDSDVLRKIKDAARNSRKPPGYLLDGREAPYLGPSPAERGRQEKRQQRDAWPKFVPLTEKSEARISELRGIPQHVVRMFNRLGYMSGAEYDRHRCFVLHERDFAQARRLDGGMLFGGGKEIKSKNLPGAEGKFIGWKTLGPVEAPILLVEGAIALLEGMAAIVAADADVRGWSCLAATSASSRFDAAELHRLKRRKFRIVPDNDRTGREAAGIWTAALRTFGCEVRVFQLPEPAKDIGDVLTDSETLTEIFAAYA